jgi:transposase-like protein
MIPEAREVDLSRKDRKVLEAVCRSPVTLQRDLKRARIALLAAAGRSTRSIAREVGVQPRIVSLWRHRFADLGLEGLQDKPRPGKQPIYTKSTDKRILKLLDKPPPAQVNRPKRSEIFHPACSATKLKARLHPIRCVPNAVNFF